MLSGFTNPLKNYVLIMINFHSSRGNAQVERVSAFSARRSVVEENGLKDCLQARRALRPSRSSSDAKQVTTSQGLQPPLSLAQMLRLCR